MNQGVIYLASGDEYIDKAINSAKSLKDNNKKIPAFLYTDEQRSSEVFDEVCVIDSLITEKGDSILTSKQMPFDKNLYLDADTYVAGNIKDIFDILDRFDIVAAHNEARAWYHSDFYAEHGIEVPDSFPEYNTGVVAYNDSDKVRSLFESWNEIYDRLEYERNQPGFRVALYESDVTIGTLPPEYNFMTHTIGFASGDVKILHQGNSDADLQEWAELLNSVPGKKVTTWEKAPCRVVPNSYKNKRYKLENFDKKDIQSLIYSAKRKQSKEGNIALINSITERVKRALTNQ